MARPRYGKIFETVWTDENFSALSDSAKILYFNLISCRKGNCIGLFQTGIGSIDDDVNMGAAKINSSFKELEKSGMIVYRKGWVYIPKFLKWNGPDSPNGAKGIGDTFNDILQFNPPSEFVANFWKKISIYTDKYKDDVIGRVNEALIKPFLDKASLEEVSGNVPQTFDKPLASPSQALTKPLARDSSQVRSEKREVISEKEEVRSDIDSSLRSESNMLSLPENEEIDESSNDSIKENLPCSEDSSSNERKQSETLINSEKVDYSLIQSKYNESCPSLPKCTMISDKRRKAIKACWNEYHERIFEGFVKAEESDFLTGREGNWSCNFDWLMITGNMLKVLEGNYVNKPKYIIKPEYINRGYKNSDLDGIESGEIKF